jgi:hypothetical protein
MVPDQCRQWNGEAVSHQTHQEIQTRRAFSIVLHSKLLNSLADSLLITQSRSKNFPSTLATSLEIGGEAAHGVG